MLYYILPKQKIRSEPSANNITAMKYTDNLKSTNTPMPWVGDFQPWNRFTYILRAGKCHKTINKRTCNHETGSLTSWEQENATRPSARGPATMKQVHLLSKSRKMPQDHQQEDLQPWNRFTYSLRAGKCHKTISKRTCNHQTGSLTAWKQANATRPSARGPAACSHETSSLTSWKQANVTRPSARGPATMKQVHLHAESRQMPQDHQQEDLQPWNRFTCILRAGKCHKTISKRTCSHETGSLTY
jgi:hypothetical protein